MRRRSWSRVKSRPIADATVNVSLHGPDRWSRRLPITSRTPSGMRTCQRSGTPGPSPVKAPSSTRRRTTSLTKNGFPSVWLCTARTRPSSGTKPQVASMNRSTSACERPRRRARSKVARGRARRAFSRAGGGVRDRCRDTCRSRARARHQALEQRTPEEAANRRPPSSDPPERARAAEIDSHSSGSPRSSRTGEIEHVQTREAPTALPDPAAARGLRRPARRSRRRLSGSWSSRTQSPNARGRSGSGWPWGRRPPM